MTNRILLLPTLIRLLLRDIVRPFLLRIDVVPIFDILEQFLVEFLEHVEEFFHLSEGLDLDVVVVLSKELFGDLLLLELLCLSIRFVANPTAVG